MKKIIYKKSPDIRARKFNELVDTKYSQFLVEKDPDIFLVAGGDGALHHATKYNTEFDGIYFGKATGSLNFLMNSFENDEEIIDGILNESIILDVIETNTLDVYINGAYMTNSANDVVLGESINSYLSFDVTSEDGSFDNFKYKGSGLCISTPLGSTAFNFNNGGRVLDLDSIDISITGVVSNRYLNDVIKIQDISIRSKSQLYVDGVYTYSLKEDDILELKQGKGIKIGFLDKEEFLKKRFKILHRKKGD